MSTLTLILALTLTVGSILITGFLASQYGDSLETFFGDSSRISPRRARTRRSAK